MQSANEDATDRRIVCAFVAIALDHPFTSMTQHRACGGSDPPHTCL